MEDVKIWRVRNLYQFCKPMKFAKVIQKGERGGHEKGL